MLLTAILLSTLAAFATILLTHLRRVREFVSQAGMWFPLFLWTCALGSVGIAGAWGTPLFILLSLLAPPTCAAILSLSWRDHRRERAL